MSRSIIRGGLAMMALLGATQLFGARTVGFETDAFNRAFPASYSKNIVFSPVSFELDCAAIAESLDTIPKADVSETMGVVIGFESSYRPIVEQFENGVSGMVFKTARAFAVSDITKAHPVHSQYLQRTYGVETMSLRPKEGVMAWFQSAMDGTMEDFEISEEESLVDGFSMYDLVAVIPTWQCASGTTARVNGDFAVIDGTTNSIVMQRGVTTAVIHETRRRTLVRIPLGEGSYLFGLMPKAGINLSEVRQEMSSTGIDGIIAIASSVAQEGLFVGDAEITLPELKIVNRITFKQILRYYHIPTTGLNNVAPNKSAQTMVQRARLVLKMKEVLSPKAAAKRVMINRPFVFWVYHEPTATILIAGQYTGK